MVHPARCARVPLARVVVLVGALVAGAGCAGDGRSPRGDGPTGAVESAIQGGATTDNYSYAVGVCVGSGGGPGVCNTICSGALVAPNMIMTSRHCVEIAPDTVIDCTKDVFGGPRTTPDNIWVTTFSTIAQTNRAWHQGVRLITTPGTSFCGRDIAVIVLKDQVQPAEASLVIPVVDAVSYDVYGTRIAAIGYGATAPDGTDFGIRRILAGVPIRCIPGDPVLDCAHNEESTYHVGPGEFLSGSGICFGDSGSSAFSQSELDNGRARSLGVLSRGLESNSICELGIYTRTDAWRGFLVYAANTAAQMGGYTPPSWVADDDAGSPYAPRALGAPCYEAEGCDTALCGSPDSEQHFYCTTRCNPSDPTTCPSDFRCAPSTDAGFCFPIAPSPAPPSKPSCSCRSLGDARTSAPPVIGGALVVVAAVAVRRRRRR